MQLNLCSLFLLTCAALLSSCRWAQSRDSCCVESRCCRFTGNAPSWLNFKFPLTRHKRTVYFSTGLLTSYRVCRAGRWLWWCVRTPLRVCGSPIPRPVGRTAAPSVPLPSAGRSCPTRQGTWLHRGRRQWSVKSRTLLRNDTWICKEWTSKCTSYSDLPSSGMGSISQGLIFSVSPLSQLNEKQCWYESSTSSNFRASSGCHSLTRFFK